ncbi:conjugal transfer protein TraG, partial [Vibrio sp. 10N.247.311.46]
NFGETQQLMNTTTKSQQEVDTLSRANSLEQREVASLTEKLEVPFQEYVEGKYKKEDGKAEQILTGSDNEARQGRADEWEKFKQTDAFKDFVLASVPSKEAHDNHFNGEPTQAEWQEMVGEQYKGKALGQTSEVILNQHEQRGGTETYYAPEAHTQIVDDTRDQFERTSAHVDAPASLQETDKQTRT